MNTTSLGPGPVRTTTTAALAAALIAAGSAEAYVHRVPSSPPPSSTGVFVVALALVFTAMAATAALGLLCGVAQRGSAGIPLILAAFPAALCWLVIPLPNRVSIAASVLLAALVLALPTAGRRRRAGPVILVAVWLLTGVQATTDERSPGRLAGIVLVLGATAALVSVTLAATADARPPVIRRFFLVGAISALVAVTAIWQRGRSDGIKPDGTLWWSSLGTLTAIEAVLLACVTLSGLVLTTTVRSTAARSRTAQSRRAMTFTVGALAGVSVVAGAALVSLPAPPAPPMPGVPLLRTLVLGDDPLPVLVVPQQPGWNLVHLSSPAGAAGLDRARLSAAAARPGASGSWAKVWLPAGRSRLWIKDGGQLGSLQVNTGSGRGRQSPVSSQFSGLDGPECASATLGALVAGWRGPLTECPAQRLDPDEAQSITAMLRFVAQRGDSTISVVGDDSPRGVLAMALIRRIAARYHLKVTGPGWHPMFVVAGWSGASTVLRQVSSNQIHTQGVYLAPWLLTIPLLTNYASPLFALRFDTTTPGPMRYLAELDQQFPGEAPSSDGYAGWLRHQPTGPLDLYATSLASVPGDPPGMDMGLSWMSDGTVVPVKGPLDP